MLLIENYVRGGPQVLDVRLSLDSTDYTLEQLYIFSILSSPLVTYDL